MPVKYRSVIPGIESTSELLTDIKPFYHSKVFGYDEDSRTSVYQWVIRVLKLTPELQTDISLSRRLEEAIGSILIKTVPFRVGIEHTQAEETAAYVAATITKPKAPAPETVPEVPAAPPAAAESDSDSSD